MLSRLSRTITFESPLSRSEIIDRITAHMHPVEKLGPTRRYAFFRTYEGHMTGAGLMLRRILKQGSHSFIPNVEVILKERPAGTMVTLTGKLSKITNVMAMIMRTFFLLMFGAILIWGEPFREPQGIFILAVALIILFASFQIPELFFGLEFYFVENDLRRSSGAEQALKEPALFGFYADHVIR